MLQRVTELRDEHLYSQGLEWPDGDFCPICSLPIPFQMEDHSGFYCCCVKMVCNGCKSAAEKKGMVDCPFCRTPLPSNDADIWQWFRHGW